MQEKRGYNRLDIDGNIRLLRKSGAVLEAQGSLENISFGGVRSLIPGPVRENTIFNFELECPQLLTPLVGRLRVKYFKPAADPSSVSVGAEFIDTDKDSLLFLLNRLEDIKNSQERMATGERPIDFMPF